jgi:hypothetical protein
MKLSRMFITKQRQRMPNCTHCACCRWCLTRDLRKNMFKLRNGPIDYYFCDADCSELFVRYRHVIGIAHILKMSAENRDKYLGGKTLMDYISNQLEEDAMSTSR